MLPARQDSVANNPIYGSHLPTSGINDDVKNTFYDSIDDLTQTKTQSQAKPENQYSTISAITTVMNPVYGGIGGTVTCSQVNFGDFQ